jgi:hypothetical protein
MTQLTVDATLHRKAHSTETGDGGTANALGWGDSDGHGVSSSLIVA